MNRWLLMIYYLLVFLLFREWLIPIIELTETGHAMLFLIFIASAFLLSLVGAKWWLTIPVKIFYILWAIYYVYVGSVAETEGSMKIVFDDLVSNIPVMMNGDWSNITNPLRTMLFFILLWMGTYLIRYWLEVRKSIFLFYFMTVAFIAVMDTFSAYSAEGSIFRVMIVGLLLLGMLTISRLGDKHETAISMRTFMAVLIPLLVVIIIGSVLTMMLPKQDSVWADPVPFLNTVKDKTKDKANGNGVSKSGYDPNDDRLGGPFLIDDSLVFEAVVDERQYWKIETKDTYTSKGWEQSKSREGNTVYSIGMVIEEPQNIQDEIVSEPKLAELKMIEKFPFIIYPYGMTTVFAESNPKITEIAHTGQYRTGSKGKEQLLDNYEVEYNEPSYSLEALRKTKMESLKSEDDFTQYLQLPDTLPHRVIELAESITSSEESVYDKATAIESYFGQDGFVYDQTDVAVPKEDEDYVDQFLFDTKQGYCDNFSTSMVVMLRAIGIPAKWVKGFAPGEISRNAEGDSIYRITNEEAHSWVEAYMPGVGWMPFEPTIGFDGLLNVNYDVASNVDDQLDAEIPQEEPIENDRNVEEEESENDSLFTDFGETLNTSLWGNLQWVVILVVVVLIVILFMMIRTQKWRRNITIWSHQFGSGNWTSYAKQYKSLLKQLHHFGLKRASGETLSAYAQRVDEHLDVNLMKELTIAYEEGIYGENRESQDWQRLQEMWKDLINRTSN